ncbi:MAG TPA: GGDEF domain-containing protein, partial [Terriglobales bacterium]|nr:GGDEF domain-containing protein [Terriglobales bacterium]
MQQSLVGLEATLAGNLTPAAITQIQSNVEKELSKWGGRSADYFKAKANEIKELLIVLAKTAESVGERDQRYASRFTELTSQLRTIADLEDIGQVRTSLVQRATELKSYVDQMARESKKSVAQLQAEVSTYETKLKAVEELALRDTLTGLANRRNVEERIEWRIQHQQEFTLVILDLNHFKQVNDTHGHNAGDSLLKQFAQELRGCIRSTDVVGRWSGDEFVVILDCDLRAAKSQLERVQKWVFGEYPIQSGKGEVKINVTAAIGLTQWQTGETLQHLIESADAAMYNDKKLTKKANA